MLSPGMGSKSVLRVSWKFCPLREIHGILLRGVRSANEAPREFRRSRTRLPVAVRGTLHLFKLGRIRIPASTAAGQDRPGSRSQTVRARCHWYSRNARETRNYERIDRQTLGPFFCQSSVLAYPQRRNWAFEELGSIRQTPSVNPLTSGFLVFLPGLSPSDSDCLSCKLLSLVGGQGGHTGLSAFLATCLSTFFPHLAHDF
jgi:hypothetical protein